MAEYKNVENIKQLFDEEFKKTRELIQKGETHLDNLAEGFLEADRVIFRLPTADVVEVVRCGQCKHWKINPNSLYGGQCRFSECASIDHFCSRGERKEHKDGAKNG